MSDEASQTCGEPSSAADQPPNETIAATSKSPVNVAALGEKSSVMRPVTQIQQKSSPRQSVSPSAGAARAEPFTGKRHISAAQGRAKAGDDSSITVDRVIDLVARGRSLHDGPSWKKPRNYTIDPSLKALQQQIALGQKAGPSQQNVAIPALQQIAKKPPGPPQTVTEKAGTSLQPIAKKPHPSQQQVVQKSGPSQQGQPIRQNPVHPQQAQPIRQNQTQQLPPPQAYRVNLNKDRQATQSGGQQQRAGPSQAGPSSQPGSSSQGHVAQARSALLGALSQAGSSTQSGQPKQNQTQAGPSNRPNPPTNASSGSSVKPNMRPVHIVATPRGLLPVPPGTKQTSSPDDHKFKKPLLPAKLRKQVDEEKRRREAFEDAQRVQRHMQEAKRAVQEAERSRVPRSSSSRNRQNLAPIPLLYPRPSLEITEEMVKQSDKEMQKVCFNQEIFDIHNVLLHSSFLLRSVCSKKNFLSLTQESQNHLKKFLPADAEENLDIYLNMAFSNVHMAGRGTPLSNLHARLKNGHFNAERINDLIHIRDTEKIMYDHYIRMYHMRMFKKLVISRHLILQQYDNVSFENIRRPGPHPRSKDNIAEKRLVRSLKRRAARRSRMITADCRQRAGEQGISSDDEAEDIGEPIHKSLQVATCPRSTIHNPRVKDLDMWQPLKIDDVKSMLKKYKKFKRTHKKAPSMNFKNIKLDHVFDRAGILAQSQKIKETVATLEKDLNRPIDPHTRSLFQ